MKKAFIFINYNNIVVLKDYLDVVKAALENNGYMCEYVKSLKGVSRKSLIVFPMGIDAVRFYLKGYKKYVIWQQGATADESFMRNHSKLRHFILNFIDVFAMRKAKFILYVSKYMRDYYEQLSKVSFLEKSYVMPCFNEILDEEIFEKKDYSQKVFTYVGSLDLWQCFEKTVKIYQKIEEQVPGCFFKILTFQVAEAKEILRRMNVKNFEVKQVPKEEVKEELTGCTYGFVIREDNIVNRVATPTKLSSYLAAGVLPVFSECLCDFAQLSEKYKCLCKVEPENEEHEILKFINTYRDKEYVKGEISDIFHSYYCKDMHIKNLSTKLGKKLC